MGLPLYVPPVESDLRNKSTSPRSSWPYGASRIRRLRRRSTEALRESRRRAILTAAAAFTSNPTPDGQTEDYELALRRQRELLREQQHRERENRRREEAHSRENARLRAQAERERLRLQEQEFHDRMRLSQELHLAGVANPARERLVRRFLERIREHERLQTIRMRELAGGESNNSNAAAGGADVDADADADADAANSAEDRPAEATETAEAADATSAPDADGAGPAGSRQTWRDYVLSTLMNDPSPTAAPSRLAATGDGASQANNGSANDDESGNRPFSLLTRDFSMPRTQSASPGQTAGNGLRNLGPERSDWSLQFLMDLEGADGDSDGAASNVAARRSRRHRSSRRTSSLRRDPYPPNASGRPTAVGWSDSVDRHLGSQSHGSSTSRIFGDASRIRTGDAPRTGDHSASEAAAGSRHGWTVRYVDVNNNEYMPSARDLFGSPVDGLGDRRRSLSPEGDGVWDTLLTTLTPDPHPPSVGSSFASSSSALAASSTEVQVPPASVRAILTRPSNSAVLEQERHPIFAETGRLEHEAGDEYRNDDIPTPVPILVEASRTPIDTGDANPAADSGSAAGVSSGTTSASASQRIRSPFTVSAPGTDTPHESFTSDGVIGGQDDDAGVCDDSEMDEARGEAGIHEDESGEEEEDEEEQAAYLGLSSGSSALRGNLPSSYAEREELLYQMRRIYGPSGELPSREEGLEISGGRGGSGGNNTEDTLEYLGIGDMQHIVRSLARREDIPDEWWAEVGLSRTLPHGNSE